MARTPSTMLALGTELPTFDLPAANPGAMGDRVASGDLQGQPVVVAFTCNHCPYAVEVEPRLIAQARRWQAWGVAVVAISSNDAEAYPEDSFRAMAARAEAQGYPFPYLYDESQDVARAFDAVCTPDFFLFDAGGRLVYRGRIDDGRPSRPPTAGAGPTTSELDDAVTQVLAGGPVTVEQVPSIGCSIKWR